MPTTTTVRHYADKLLVALAMLNVSAPVSVEREADGIRVVISVTPSRGRGGARSGCRKEILTVLSSENRPLTRKVIAHRLRAKFGASTIAKVLAELTREGVLVNPRDGRGYRLPTEFP